jgi:rare lipoprotein A
MKRNQIIFVVLFIVMIVGCTQGKSQVRNENQFDSERYDETVKSNDNHADEYGAESKKNSAYREQDFNPKKEEFRKINAKSNQYDKRNNDSYSRRSRSGENYENVRGSGISSEDFYQKGKASWYGREFNGKVTASGEKFNMHQYTAAHKSLPFGTILTVKNLTNGKIVKVRINDRGPYRGNRIIDLSYGAAKEIGMVSSGELLVGINIVDPNKSNNEYGEKSRREGRTVKPVVSDYPDDNNFVDESTDGSFSVQAGAFYSRRNANKLKSKIMKMTDNNVKIIKENDLYKVRIEGVNSKTQADKLKRRLNDDDISSFVITE